MNKVMLIGRLSRDPALNRNGDTVYSKFYLAVDKPYYVNKNDSADFIPCTFFGKTAETVAKHLKKGDKVAVTGRLSISKYVKDDENRQSFSVICDEFEFCQNKKNNAEENKEFVPADEDELPF